MVREKQANGHATHEKQQNGSAVSHVTRDEATDIERWRLLDERGQQTWHYLETDEQVNDWPQSAADRYHLGLPLVSANSHAPLSVRFKLTDQDD